MTAPLTPRDNQPPEEPRHPEAAPAADDGGLGGPELARELREGALIALLVAATGVLLGLLWNWLAPHVPLIADTRNVYLKNTEGEESIGADGTFLLLAFAFGVLTTAAVFLFRRRGGIPLVVALVVGGLLGATVGWLTGMWLGPTPDVAEHAKQVGPGVAFDGPLRLQAKGALLAWPIGAMLTQLVLSALFGPPDPEPEVPYWLQGQGQGQGQQGQQEQQFQGQQEQQPEVPQWLRENHDQRPPSEG
ncbi:ABC transporter permease [Streptomyces sp. ID38640]|uniref:ABC transporter permease n=1 Tax=Streptomyces sp. ID38640 TaxID=1265399 RepID=UPI00140EF5F7|nr:ABC transporter permease [Streptomyces sp. ID38640]QIK09254.1 ABC transporter permease [Streptomyces sp. ID38640]